jgi:hypothetical protein
MQKKPRSSQQHQGKRNLRNHQCPAQALASTITGRLTTAFLQGNHHIGFRRGQGRHQARQQSPASSDNPMLNPSARRFKVTLSRLRRQREFRRQPGFDQQDYPRGNQNSKRPPRSPSIALSDNI